MASEDVMTEKLCSNCRFWGTNSEEHESNEYKQCQSVIHDDECLSGQDSQPDDDLPSWKGQAKVSAWRSTHKACVQDGSGYWAALRTSKDFGCVLFQD